MPGEGTKDRPGNNFLLKFLKDRVWNYFAGQTCSKVLLLNDTGVASVRGTVVIASTATDNAFEVSGVDEEQPIGIVAEDGIADGDFCWVITHVIAYVLLENATAATRGNWVYTSGTAGRADATLATPPAGGVAELQTHMQELGHCLESVTAGTDKLCKIMVHLN